MHRLHPYLGKFPPQLAEALLRRRFTPGALVYDPFAGSGTTLVESSVLGIDAIGCDVSAFNCLLTEVKTAPPDLDGRRPSWPARWRSHRSCAGRRMAGAMDRAAGAVRAARIPVGAGGIPAAGDALDRRSRAARSARRVPHHALDDARQPVTAPYWCYKHRRECRPGQAASRFLTATPRTRSGGWRSTPRCAARSQVAVLHADARSADLPDAIDGIVTSPPYPGLIDYHEQHRYAYELLGLDDRRELELGAAAGGTTKRAIAVYCDGMVEALAHSRRYLRRGAAVAIVVNDRRGLYDEIALRAGYTLGAAPAARQPAHRPARRRVLRGRAVAAAARRPPRRLDQEVADQRPELGAAGVVAVASAAVRREGNRQHHSGRDHGQRCDT